MERDVRATQIALASIHRAEGVLDPHVSGRPRDHCAPVIDYLREGYV